MKSSVYLKKLFAIIGMVVIIYVGYVYYFYKNYPLPLTENIYFDAKLKFIREKIDANSVDTIIIGSSVGLNNIQGVYLEKASKQAEYVLNLSVHGAYTMRTQQLLELTVAFPNLKRVVYAVQYTDLGITHQYENFDADYLVKYIRNEFNFFDTIGLLLKSCNNLFFCINRQSSWHTYSEKRNTFTSVKYDTSGSVPLHMYGDDINLGRWSGAQPGYMPEKSYGAIYQMSQKMHQKGILFYLVQQDYRKEIFLRDKRVQHSMLSFEKRAKDIVEKNGGKYLNLFYALHLSDKYFADRNHLNDQGSKVAAIEVAKFIDSCER